MNHRDEAELLKAVEKQPIAGGIEITTEFRALKGVNFKCSYLYCCYICCNILIKSLVKKQKKKKWQQILYQYKWRKYTLGHTLLRRTMVAPLSLSIFTLAILVIWRCFWKILSCLCLFCCSRVAQSHVRSHKHGTPMQK